MACTLHVQRTLSKPILARPARPGLRGYLGDFLSLVLGTKLLPQTLLTLIFTVPLPFAAASHLIVVWKMMRSGGLDACHTAVRVRAAWVELCVYDWRAWKLGAFVHVAVGIHQEGGGTAGQQVTCVGASQPTSQLCRRQQQAPTAPPQLLPGALSSMLWCLQLLRHPLMQDRLAVLARLGDMFVVALTPVGHTLPHLRRPSISNASAVANAASMDCRHVMIFTHAVWAVLPVMALAWSEHDPEPPLAPAALQPGPGDEALPAELSSGTHSQDEQRQLRQGYWEPAGQRLRLHRAWHRLHCVLRRACGCYSSCGHRAAIVAWLLPMLWLATYLVA